MQSLTASQRVVLQAIEDFIRFNGHTPSFAEIGHATGLSSLATVHRHISNLERKGFLVREFNRSRSIRLRKNTLRLGQKCPLCGTEKGA